jgi:hypothetical protein
VRAIDRSNVTSTILGGDKFAFDFKDGRSRWILIWILVTGLTLKWWSC